VESKKPDSLDLNRFALIPDDPERETMEDFFIFHPFRDMHTISVSLSESEATFHEFVADCFDLPPDDFYLATKKSILDADSDEDLYERFPPGTSFELCYKLRGGSKKEEVKVDVQLGKGRQGRFNKTPKKRGPGKKEKGRFGPQTKKQKAKANAKKVQSIVRKNTGVNKGNKTFSALSGLQQAILRSIVTPMDANPIRYSDGFTSEETAIANPFARIDAPWGSNVSGPIPSSDLIFFLFRNPMCFMIFTINALAAAARYAGSVIDDSGLPLTVFNIAETGQTIDLSVPQFKRVVDPGFPAAPHGDNWYTGQEPSGSEGFIWLDVGTEVRYEGTGSGTDTYTIILNYFDGETIFRAIASTTGINSTTFQAQGTIGQNVGGVNWTSLKSGYYSISITQTGPATSCQLLVTYSAGQFVMAHQPIPDFPKNVNSVEAIRIIGASVMYSNTESVLERQGSIVAKQIPQEVPWTNFLTSTNNLAALNKSVKMEIKNGMYAFLKPAKELDYTTIKTVGKNSTGEVNSSGFPLRPDHSYIAMRATITDPSGKDGYFTVAAGLEFSTLDTWRPTQPPATPSVVYKAAIEHVKDVPQFHENPTHLKEIFGKILSVVNGGISAVRKYGPTVVKTAESLAPIVAGLAL
jgi:hypothetical protein